MSEADVCPMTLPHMRATSTTHRSGVYTDTRLDNVGNHVLMARPATTGAITTCSGQISSGFRVQGLGLRFRGLMPRPATTSAMTKCIVMCMCTCTFMCTHAAAPASARATTSCKQAINIM